MSDNHKTIQYNLRMTEELRERIKQSASEHNRTMNQDIIARIEDSFTPRSVIQNLPLEHLLGHISDRLAREGLRIELFSRFPKDDNSMPPYKSLHNN